jgi:hypothetical protein
MVLKRVMDGFYDIHPTRIDSEPFAVAVTHA